MTIVIIKGNGKHICKGVSAINTAEASDGLMDVKALDTSRNCWMHFKDVISVNIICGD